MELPDSLLNQTVLPRKAWLDLDVLKLPQSANITFSAKMN